MAGRVAISSGLTFLRVRGLMSVFEAASNRNGVNLTFLLAIASRESNMGLSLSSEGTGDYGNGYGIMQIDKRYHPQFTDHYDALDHESNIHYGAEFLGNLLDSFGADERKASAAYNAGETRVRNAVNAGLSPDAVTTGSDYGDDVARRKQIIKQVIGYTQASATAVYALPVTTLLASLYYYSTIKSE